jgi:hypothetical protein
MRSLISLAVLLAMIVPAAASGQVSMICKNPRGEYLVVFDPSARTLILNPDSDASRYKVLAIESTPDRLTVAGMVGFDSDMGFSADFQPKHQVAFYVNETVRQTDRCQPPTDMGLGK